MYGDRKTNSQLILRVMSNEVGIRDVLHIKDHKFYFIRIVEISLVIIFCSPFYYTSGGLCFAKGCRITKMWHVDRKETSQSTRTSSRESSLGLRIGRAGLVS